MTKPVTCRRGLLSDGNFVTTPNPTDAGSGEVVAASAIARRLPPALRWDNTQPGHGERLFRRLSEGSGVLIVVLIAAIGGFLLMRAVPALSRDKENFFTYGANW